MLDDIKKNYSLIRILIVLLIIAVGGYVLSLAWVIISKFVDIFAILLSAWLLSFILEPIVERIQKICKSSKLVATIITYLLTCGVIVIITIGYIPMVASQIAALTHTTPQYMKSAPPLVVAINESISGQVNNTVILIPSVAQFLFLAFITLILSFYFIVDREIINKEFFNLMPRSWHSILRFTQKVINDIFISFIKVQLFYAVSSGVLTWFILILFNIPFAASIGFIAGIFAFIPLIGPLLALLPPVLFAFLADPAKALFIFIVLLVIQQVIFNVIGPKLLGKAFQLHPAVILISFLIGLQFAGAIGAVFAIPVLGISAVMIRRFGHYFLEIKDETTKHITESSKR